MGNRLRRRNEPLELFLGQQDVLVRRRQNHALVADEQLRIWPRWDAAVGPDRRLDLSLVPRERQRRQVRFRQEIANDPEFRAARLVRKGETTAVGRKRGAGTFPRVLGRFVRDEKWLTQPEAI